MLWARWLFIGGSFEESDLSGFNGLARAGLPTGSVLPDEVVPFWHFLKDTDGAVATGTVYALEYWAKGAEWDEVRGIDAEWELFVGGDFNRMGDPASGDWMSNPDEVHFVARCVYEASRERFTMHTLATAGQAAELGAGEEREAVWVQGHDGPQGLRHCADGRSTSVEYDRHKN